jgi:UDP-glucose 4-epimerase
MFNAVGTRETNPHLVPEVVEQILKGCSELRLGNTFPTRDFVDVETQAKAIVDATFANRGIETVNVGSGVAVRVKEMIDLIVSEAGRDIYVVEDPAKVRAAERTNLCGTTNRLNNLIGYVPAPAGRDTIRSILRGANYRLSAVQKTGVAAR